MFLKAAQKGKNLKVSTVNDDLFTDIGTRNQAGEYLAYHSVSYCYRAIDIRARSVSTIPLEWNTPDHLVTQALTPLLPSLFWLIEASLAIYGAAYILNGHNQFGVPKPRWLLPTTITPRYIPNEGLAWFDRVTVYEGEKSYEQLSLDEVTYFWYPNLFSEMGSGVSPTRVALHAANVLIGLDEFSAQYFQRGAIKAVLLQAGSNDPLQGTPPKEEIDRLRWWWKNLVQGVRNAFNSVVVTTQVNPVVIGEGLQELDESKVIGTRIEDISVAYGVPLSLMLPKAATYATAQQDFLNLFTLTTIPETELICNILNSQLLARYGLELHPVPEKTDVMSFAEMQRATALRDLVDSNILTLDEARERLGLEPLGDRATPIEFTDALLQSGAFSINDIRASYGLDSVDASTEEKFREFNRTFSLLRAAKDAGMDLDQAAQFIGITLPKPPEVVYGTENTANLPTQATTQPITGVGEQTIDQETQALRSLYKDVERLYLGSVKIDSSLLAELQNLIGEPNETIGQVISTQNGTSDDSSQTYP